MSEFYYTWCRFHKGNEPLELYYRKDKANRFRAKRKNMIPDRQPTNQNPAPVLGAVLTTGEKTWE